MDTLRKLSAHVMASMITPSSDVTARTTADRVSGLTGTQDIPSHSAFAAYLAQQHALRMAGKSPR